MQQSTATKLDIIEKTKVCKLCGRDLELAAFRRQKNGKCCWCKQCEAAYAKAKRCGISLDELQGKPIVPIEKEPQPEKFKDKYLILNSFSQIGEIYTGKY